MGAIRATQCRVCGAPREEGSTDLLCAEHRRERERSYGRKRRSKPPSEYLSGPRKFPRGCCAVCGVKSVASGRCAEHAREYQRGWAERKRRENGLPIRRRFQKQAAEPKPTKPIKARAYVEDVFVLIGPDAFPPIKPVDVSGYDLTRWKSPGIVAEEEQREREWSEWFAARGL